MKIKSFILCLLVCVAAHAQSPKEIKDKTGTIVALDYSNMGLTQVPNILKVEKYQQVKKIDLSHNNMLFPQGADTGNYFPSSVEWIDLSHNKNFGKKTLLNMESGIPKVEKRLKGGASFLHRCLRNLNVKYLNLAYIGISTNSPYRFDLAFPELEKLILRGNVISARNIKFNKETLRYLDVSHGSYDFAKWEEFPDTTTEETRYVVRPITPRWCRDSLQVGAPDMVANTDKLDISRLDTFINIQKDTIPSGYYMWGF